MIVGHTCGHCLVSVVLLELMLVEELVWVTQVWLAFSDWEWQLGVCVSSTGWCRTDQPVLLCCGMLCCATLNFMFIPVSADVHFGDGVCFLCCLVQDWSLTQIQDSILCIMHHTKCKGRLLTCNTLFYTFVPYYSDTMHHAMHARVYCWGGRPTLCYTARTRPN